MRKQVNDGGPAFPGQTLVVGNVGMTLRDWLAGRLAAAMISTGIYKDPETLARDTYAMTDAMLAEREKGE